MSDEADIEKSLPDKLGLFALFRNFFLSTYGNRNDMSSGFVWRKKGCHQQRQKEEKIVIVIVIV